MNTFKKSERLCDLKSTENLFSNGKSLSEDPFRLVYLEVDEIRNSCVKTQIVVPKRNVIKAVNRNKIYMQTQTSTFQIYKILNIFLLIICE